MKILNATYGNKDVTTIVSNSLKDDKLSFYISNNFFGGDPLPNVVKQLIIKYEEDGVKKEYTFHEGEMCKLPIFVKPRVLYNGKPKKIKFIIPVPDVSYYLWQVLVQINNFRRLGYEVDAHYPVGCFNGTKTEILDSLLKSVNIKTNFHIYYDSREDKSYSASLKPWLMAQYFKEFPEEKDNVYVYLDTDVIFLKSIDWGKFADDNIWYESDTCSYLDSRYIKSKGEQLFYEMCEIVDIDPQVVLDNDKNCGGAQYITKNNTFEYWDEVQRLSIPLYRHMTDTADKYKPVGDPYPIQAWTSEMWTTNWVLWKHNIETKCAKELEFHWANHEMKNLTYSIYHNAGVVANDGKNFAKTAYQSSPFNKEIIGTIDSISYKYIEEIRDTETNFPELVSVFK